MLNFVLADTVNCVFQRIFHRWKVSPLTKDESRYKSGRPVSLSERKLILNFYELGYSRQLIGSALRSQGIRIDNNSIQSVINEQKVKRTKAYVEHQKESKRNRRTPHTVKSENAKAMLRERKFQSLIRKIGNEIILDEESEEPAQEDKTKEKMDNYAMNWLKKNLGARSHEYPIMGLVVAERPVFYAGRRQKTPVIPKGIAIGTPDASRDFRRLQQILENYQDEMVRAEILYWDYSLNNWVSEDYVKDKVIDSE